MVSLRKKEKQGWSRSAPQQANSDLLHEEAPGASTLIASSRASRFNTDICPMT
jgi:hypothetical protein